MCFKRSIRPPVQCSRGTESTCISYHLIVSRPTAKYEDLHITSQNLVIKASSLGTAGLLYRINENVSSWATENFSA